MTWVCKVEHSPSPWLGDLAGGYDETMSLPTRVYCRVIGCLSREGVDVAVVGSPGRPELPGDYQPRFVVATEMIPADKRFPNAIVWFDIEQGTGSLAYVEPSEP